MQSFRTLISIKGTVEAVGANGLEVVRVKIAEEIYEYLKEEKTKMGKTRHGDHVD